MNACPRCSAKIQIGDVNIADGVALCRQCGQLSRLSDVVGLTQGATSGEVPGGCSVWTQDDQTQISASTRCISSGIAFSFAAITMNAIVLTMFVAAWSAVFDDLRGQPVGGFGSSPGLALAIGVLTIPLLGLGGWMALAAASYFAGTIDVQISRANSQISTGVASLRWRTSFDIFEVSCVRDIDTARYRGLCLEGRSPKHFALGLDTHRRRWLAGAMQEAIGRARNGRTG